MLQSRSRFAQSLKQKAAMRRAFEQILFHREIITFKGTPMLVRLM